MKNGFWGIHDASVSFCENKYERYYWIAEYHNTISSVCYIVVGLLIMQTRLKFIGQLLCGVGIGAGLLHATLRHWAQMGDEMAMLTMSFYTLKELRPRTSKYLLYPMLISYCLFSRYFIVFFLTFTGLQLLIAKYARRKINIKNKKWILLYFISFISGLICWFADQFCKTSRGSMLEPYQLHAWWHLFTASAIGFGFIALND